MAAAADAVHLLRPSRYTSVLTILLTCHAGFSKLPVFPPPQCGSSVPTHALIICSEKLARDKNPIMALRPVPSASIPITILITELFENRMNTALLLLLNFLICALASLYSSPLVFKFFSLI